VVEEIPAECKKGLDTNTVYDIIMNCQFKNNKMPTTFEYTPNGGVFIQGDVTIAVDGKHLTTNPPLIVFSPFEITITREGTEHVVIPRNPVGMLTVVTSKLTEEELDLLEYHHHMDEYWEDLGTEDYVNIGLAALQAILIPLTLLALMYTHRQRKIALELTRTIHGTGNRREIYKKNHALLSKNRR
jgi:hypothetical protein